MTTIIESIQFSTDYLHPSNKLLLRLFTQMCRDIFNALHQGQSTKPILLF